MDISTSSKPYRHWLIDGAVPDGILDRTVAAIPPDNWPNWVRYANSLERKRTTEAKALGGELFGALLSWPWLTFLEWLTGITGLDCDAQLYGGGIHVADPGDSLGCHLDFAMHPKLDVERRLNLLVYLNPEWRPEWGGATQLYDATARHVVREIEPRPGRLLLWECSEVAYHGAAAVTGPRPRMTAAVYYYTTPRPGCSPRRRALFVPQR